MNSPLNSIVLTQLDFNKPISNILLFLENAGWATKKSFKNSFFNFDLPDILLSKKIVKYSDLKLPKQNKDYVEKITFYDDKCMELLGCYTTEYNGQNKEGTIVIYYKKIIQVSEFYVSECGGDINQVIADLLEIILIHESIHWIMHWIKSPISYSNLYASISPFKYNTWDSINFHEGFAQLFTFFYVQFEFRKLSVFKWLEKDQPSQYHIYKELISAKIIGPIQAIQLLIFLREDNIQSFKKTLDLAQFLIYNSIPDEFIKLIPMKRLNEIDNDFDSMNNGEKQSIQNNKSLFLNYLNSNLPFSQWRTIPTNMAELRIY